MTIVKCYTRVVSTIVSKIFTLANTEIFIFAYGHEFRQFLRMTHILFSSTLPHRNKALLVFCKESSISKDYLSFEGLKIYHEIAHLNILAIIPSDIHLHLGFIYHYKISTVVKPAKSLN